MTFFLVVVASLCGGLLSVIAASAVLFLKKSVLEQLLPRLVSFSTGTLLGASLLGMIPHAAETMALGHVAQVLLAGFLVFFILEKLLVWRHCHRHNCEVHASSGPLLFLGDAFHNFVDGVVIAGAFLVSTPLGITAAFSTIAHEIPQELGEFVVYLNHGYSRRNALLLNGATSLTCVLGAVFGYFFLAQVSVVWPYLLAFAAAGFLYVALADLIPAQRGRTSLGVALFDLALVIAGVGVISLLAHEH